jgi:hypothetical protein
MKRLALALTVAAIVVACKKDAQPQPPVDSTAAPVAAPVPADSAAARDTTKAATDTAKAPAQH